MKIESFRAELFVLDCHVVLVVAMVGSAVVEEV